NSSDRMVFLMAGEQLVGAKQNRVLNASIMVPPQSTLSIPVSCVEAGRWRYRTPKFAGSDTMSHGLLRKLMAFGIDKSYRREGTPTSDQSEVWAEVSRKLHGMGANSPSSELHQAYADYAPRLHDLLCKLHVPADCTGVAFAVGGRIAGA